VLKANKRGFPLKAISLCLAFLIVGGSSLFALYVSPVLSTGSGYAAKQICSGHFLSGMSPQVMVDEALVGVAPLFSNTTYEINRDAGAVDTRLYGWFPRTAVFTPGLGCTLLPIGEVYSPHIVQVISSTPPNAYDSQSSNSATSPASKQRLDDVLDNAFEEVDPLAPRNTKAVVIMHNGEIVAERYAEGVDTNTPLIGWSMSKTVTNLLVGVLVAETKFDIFDPAPVPEWTASNDDSRSDITTDQLLRMSSGLAFDEEYGFFSDVTVMLSREPDMGRFAASKSLAATPGSKWHYSSGDSVILAGIVRREVGGSAQDFYDFAQQHLFQPLGIRSATLELDASGTFVGSSYAYASARDWAKLGQLCLQKGFWQDQQLLPDWWVDYSLTPTPNNPANNHGAHVWLNANPKDGGQSRVFPSLPDDAFAMDGYQGQMVVVVPSKNLVVVRMGFTPGDNHGVEAIVAEAINALAAP
jgi:hypothetical protein